MDEVLLGKADIIERCLQRIETVYIGSENELETNYIKQDSIILNIQRMCEASIGAAMHIVRCHKLGIPRDSRQAFTMLVNAKLIDKQLGEYLEAMVGFRNVAVHNYTEINMEVVRGILNEHMDDMKAFSRLLIKQSLP
ncbi:Protein of unknown function DUF86, SO_3166 group [hydrothermal vent metagenome]|uniref:DUF86 domain-containing protein n=1 Tax=hydrothermal vent metagenome TaxID=652676 RepID=A0A3B0WH49_9ZZZZ